MTADEFLDLHVDEDGIELVNGEIVMLPMSGPRHGYVCGNAVGVLGEFVESHHLGRMACNGTFIRTKSDGCRSADLVYVSYSTLSADSKTPRGALIPPFELVVEVTAETDTAPALGAKVTEYLAAGVKVVVVIDSEIESAAVYRKDENPVCFQAFDELALPDILPGFSVPVKRFFE